MNQLLFYPSKKPVKIGDYIWFDEGMAAGYVSKIYTDAVSSQRDSGYLEPSISIGLFPPNSFQNIEIGMPYAAFEDEGIDLVSGEEVVYVQKALKGLQERLEVKSALLAVFKISEGNDSFPLVIVRYDNERNPIVGYKCTDSANAIHYTECSLDKIPPFAWPVGGGGPK